MHGLVDDFVDEWQQQEQAQAHVFRLRLSRIELQDLEQPTLVEQALGAVPLAES